MHVVPCQRHSAESGLQTIDNLTKNPKSFTRNESELIKASHPGKDKALKLMEDDAKRYAEVVAKTGARVSKFEAVSTITIKYEADLDLPSAAAEGWTDT